MLFSSFLIALAITWVVAVVDTVVESAREGGEVIMMFSRELWIPTSAEMGILFLCALSATASLALVTAVAMARGRRLRRRMAEELSEQVEEVKRNQYGAAGLATLLPTRVAELQTSVETLTARRDGLLEEIKTLEERRARKAPSNVVVLPEATGDGEVVDVSSDASPSDETEPAGSA
jgi:hypothetical protein